MLSGLQTGYLLLVARWRPQISHACIITGNVCENSSFEKIRTIAINLIQLHYFDDVINEFNLIDLKIRYMNCDSCFKTKETTHGMFSILVLGKSRKSNMNYMKMKLK